ncbi:MAG TPA: Gfo/Idh/MocA family oxidoreductase [Bryobacteraceae bacterium]|nr:Gfo/Idh/MocA family oxidoreductase [Bryobacteraceae bacterium]
MTRRNLISTAGAAFTAVSQSRIWGANERLSIALIGCGARGLQLQPHFQKLNAPLTAVCDLWRTRAEKAQSLAAGSRVFDDHRKVLEIPGLDAVIIATSDHWHARIAVDALSAGKDVYVEKPLTRTIEEGVGIINAARANNRVCQVGAQQRSGTHYMQARDEYIKPGKLGKIHLVRTWWNDGLSSGQARAASAVAPTGGHSVPPGLTTKPDDLDWNRYVAPVRWRPWNPPQFFNFRNYMDFCGGILTDKYVHWVDVVHMFLGEDVPLTADTAGGIYAAKDGRTVPDTLNVHYEYPGNWVCTYTNVPQAGLQREGIEFCGTQAHLRIDRTKFEVFPSDAREKPLVVECKTDLVEEHVANFIGCVKSRKMPNGDVEMGHRSAIAAHLGNLSWIERRRVRFDSERELVLPA